jgi:DNA-binding beta-propeller fold protein YncE
MKLTRTRRALAITVAALALGTSAASAAEVPDHTLNGSITGERIDPPGQFKDACGVAVDAQGDVYVSDYYQNRIVIFNKKWEYLTQIDQVDPLDAGGVAPLDGPCDLAVDSAGLLYVNDYHRDVVRFIPAQYPPQKGTAYGARETIDENHSTGVAVDLTTGDVYVDDRTDVAHYEAPVTAGELPVAKIGDASLQDGYGVAISRFESAGPLIYAADAASETIKVYDPALDLENPQSEIRGEGTEQGGFYLTDTDLAVDPEDGHLYVAQNLEPHFEEKLETVVDEFSPTGFYRGPVPRSFANGFESFLQNGEPTGLATYKGELYVTSGNYENAAVFVFGPPAPFDPRLLTVTKSGAGEGTVTSTPAAIGCGQVCKAEINKEVNVVLKAEPAPGSVFAGWSGCDEVPSPNRCAVSMSASRTVTAEFELAPAPAAAATLGLVEQPEVASAVPAALSPRSKPRRRHHRKHRHPRAHRRAVK